MKRAGKGSIYELFIYGVSKATGTQEEIAKQLGITTQDLRNRTSQSRLGFHSNNKYDLRLIEDKSIKWEFNFDDGSKMIGSINEIYDTGKTFYSKNHLRKVCHKVS